MRKDTQKTIQETLTVKEAAFILKCSKKTIYKLLKNKRFKTVQLGRAIRINRRDFYQINRFDLPPDLTGK